MKSFIKENTWLTRGIIDFGWGNGYVIIPKDHPLNGKNYDEIHDLMPKLDVNGGLTFSKFTSYRCQCSGTKKFYISDAVLFSFHF